MSLTSTIGISPPEQQNKEHRPADERHYRADGQDYRRRDQLCERVREYQQQRTADRGAGDKEAVVIADKKAHDMRRDEADKADYADKRHRDRRRQRAHRHAGDHDLLRVHAEALGRVVARLHGVIVPAVIHVVDEAQHENDADKAQILPACAAEVAEGPEHDRAERGIVGEVLQQRAAAGEHRAERRAREDQPAGADVFLEPGDEYHDDRRYRAEDEGAERDDIRVIDRYGRGGVGVCYHAAAEHDYAQRCAESRALRHAQRRCRGERVAQYALHHRAGGRERCADEYRRQNARQADVHNGGLIFLFALAGERTENVRQADFQRADAHIHHGGKERNKRRSRKRYALAGDELFILFDFYWVLLQLYHTFVIRE